MQNKGFVRVFAVLLALVSLYQLSFTFKVNNIENDAEVYAERGDTPDEQLKLRHSYLDSLSNITVYDIGIKEFTYRDCQALQLNLGLDLKGGMNVMLEVSVPDIIKALSNNSKDATYVKAIALATERMQDSQDDFITLFGAAFQEIDNGASLAAIFSTFELKEKIAYNSTNKEVMNVLRVEAADAISNSFNVLRTRIDRFGVAQPNIQRVGSETSGRILIELPGVKDRERVRKLLQGTANLEFWETYENQEVYAALIEANAVLKDLLFEEVETETTVAP
ncbi:MAG: protein translocase subunit SecDF, partial [Bacteroidales bacterium]|nr:protein translocase subunit SecDF [Bacteroidales bacterium]